MNSLPHIRLGVMLVMMGAVGLLMVQQVIRALGTGRHRLHFWSAGWSAVGMAFIAGRLIQHGGQTLAASLVGTRIQFVCAFVVGVVTVGLLRALSQRQTSPVPLAVATVAGLGGSLLTVSTDLLVGPTGRELTTLFTQTIYVLDAGPWIVLVLPYLVAVAGYCVHLARRVAFGAARLGWMLIALTAFFCLTLLVDLAAVVGLQRSVQVLDLGFFTAAVGLGYVAHREAMHRVDLLQQGVIAKTEQIRVQAEELRRSSQHLEASDRLAALGRLAAGVAHEINNPLMYVLTNVLSLQEALADAPLTEEQRAEFEEVFADCEEGCKRIERIVSDLQTLSRDSDEGRRHSAMNPAVERGLRIAGNELRHCAQVVRELGEVPPVAIEETRLGQVFLNLLVNAGQSFPAGASTGSRITVRTRTDGDRVVLEVEDTGCGIDPSVQRRVFEPFYTTKDVGRGTGLGLSICHGIVTDVGGTIEVESEVGVGTSVRVSLPAVKTLAAPRPFIEAPAPAGDGGPRVLIVDDDELLAKAVCRQLNGYATAAYCCTGSEAVAWICDRQPDLVLCDLMMPGMTGMGVYQQVARHDAQLARRFVFMTGGVFSAEAAAFVEETDRDVLQKPLSRNSLRDLLQRRAAEWFTDPE